MLESPGADVIQAKKQGGFVRAASLVFRVFGPLVFTLAPYVAWVPITLTVVYHEAEPTLWYWLILPASWSLEILATFVVDRRPAGRFARGRLWGSLLVRLLFMSAAFWISVGVPLAWARHNTPDYFAPLVSFWPWVAMFPYVAAPVPGFIGLALLLALHVWQTIGRGRLRLTTTIILPGLFTLGLFLFWYLFPGSDALLDPKPSSRYVEWVFPSFADDREGRYSGMDFYPRDMYVMPDEQSFVASSGRTFFPSLDDVNLWEVDLSSGRVRASTGSVIRRFQSTCSDWLYTSPWHEHSLSVLHTETGMVEKYEYPREANGYPLVEANYVLHDCARNRVIVGNSRNPVLIVWDTLSESLFRTVNLVETAGMRLGDSLGIVTINPKSGNIYIGLWGRWPYIELDGETLRPLRFGQLPAFAFDIHVSRDGDFLYVPAMFRGKVWKIDAGSLEVVAAFDVPIHCRRVDTTPEGDVLLVLSYLTGDLLSYDARTTKLIRSVHIGPKPEALFVTSGYAWFFSADGAGRVPLDIMKKAGD